MAAVNYDVEATLAYLGWLSSEDSEEEQFLRTLRDYAGGEQPTYLTERQREYIGLRAKDADHLFAHNICHLIIASVVERMHVTGFQPVDASNDLGIALSQWAMECWDANRMDAKQDDLHEYAVQDAESYLIVEFPAGDDYPRWTVNKKFDGTQGVKLHRDPSTDEVIFASKRWQEHDQATGAAGRTRLTIYFPNRVERWVSAKAGEGVKMTVRETEIVEYGWKQYLGPQGTDAWPIWWTEDGTPSGEPLGMAVISFNNPGGSEIAQVLQLQDALNKGDLDLLAAEDTAGFRILWASGVKAVIDPATGKEKTMPISPSTMIRIDDPAGKLGSIEPTDLPKMIAGSHYWIESIAGVSRTPQYLLRAPGADPASGESMKQQEIGLEAKCKRKARVWGNAYEDAITLSVKLWNRIPGNERIEPARLQTQWASVEVRNLSEDLASAEKAQNVGVAQEMIWEQFLGMDSEQVERNKELLAEQKTANQSPAEQFLSGLENR